MSVKVEIGFTASGASAPFFTLGDETLGVLGGTQGLLGGGEILVDVTAFLRSFQVSRGKSRDLDRHQAGQATFSFKNDERVFDPTFEAGQFFGQIEPRRQISSRERLTTGISTMTRAEIPFRLLRLLTVSLT